jgi:hypothetical protein
MRSVALRMLALWRAIVTKRESWAMLEALRRFNSRLEALAVEVSGLRAIVNMQSRQIAAFQSVRPVTRYTKTPTAPIALAASSGRAGACCQSRPPRSPAGTTTRLRMP